MRRVGQVTGKKKAQDLYQIIGLIRPLYGRLANAVSFELKGGEISTAGRRIMECLHDGPGSAVPEIADRLLLKRQSVQKVVDDLLAVQCVESRKNPRHKRSRLYVLTRLGRSRFEAIRAREQINLEKVAKKLDASDIEACQRVMLQLTEAFSDRLKWRGA